MLLIFSNVIYLSIYLIASNIIKREKIEFAYNVIEEFV
jgi:hypothetical protein